MGKPEVLRVLEKMLGGEVSLTLLAHIEIPLDATCRSPDPKTYRLADPDSPIHL